MRQLQFSWIEIAFGIATSSAVLLCLCAAAYSVVSKGFGADAAAWVQGAGSIAAIAGASWISSAESRRQRRVSRLKGEELAWAVRHSIDCCQVEISLTVQDLQRSEPPLDSDDSDVWKNRFSNVRRLIAHYASRTDHIHPGILQDANNALLLIEEFELTMSKAVALLYVGEFDKKDFYSELEFLNTHLETLKMRLDARMRGIREALDRGGDMLPIFEMVDWDAKRARARRKLDFED